MAGSVINVRLATGTSLIVKLATVTDMLRLATRRPANVTSVKTSLQATIAIDALRDTTAIRCLVARLAADLADAPTQLHLVTPTPASVL